MTGGGFDGFAIALVHTQDAATAARDAAVAAGHAEPVFLLAEASSGAGRLR